MADIDIDTTRSVSPGPENKPLRTHASAPLEDEIQAALESDESVLSPLSTEKVPSVAELKGKSLRFRSPLHSVLLILSCILCNM